MTKSKNAVNHELPEITLRLFGDYPKRFCQGAVSPFTNPHELLG